ncbi:hypothetical protein CSA37_08465 [Candidatus Fermentibacteria bacterium]|nr:MAG: hypothetical protein CSA37_08465 [Candidatus Fermentibacteria bacterium]
MILSAALLAGFIAVPSRYTSVEVDIEWNGTVKETTVAYTASAGDDGRFLQVKRDFDPDYMEVELLHAEYGFEGALRSVPDWAVKTLTGSEGWPGALVVAFPGLRPGMEMEWTFRIRDEGRLSSAGLFYTYIAGREPAAIEVRCPDAEGLSFRQSGFVCSSRGDRRVFVSNDQNYRELWISTAESWEEVGNLLLESSRASAEETPPDLREAAIEAGAAGALPQMRISRGRVLITESMQLLPFPGGDAGFSVRSIQEILDSRRATPMEAATLLSAMCRVMGIDAPVVPATDILPPIPSPLGFNRAFILAEGNLEEPGEYLSPAGWVDMQDTLWLLLPGGILGELPPETLADSCGEEWEIFPDQGLFTLTVTAFGGFDRELRRKMAGRDANSLLLAAGEWFRASGIHFVPSSVHISDLYDLAEAASITVTGTFPEAEECWLEEEPILKWNRVGTVERTFTGVTREGGVLSR